MMVLQINFKFYLFFLNCVEGKSKRHCYDCYKNDDAVLETQHEKYSVVSIDNSFVKLFCDVQLHSDIYWLKNIKI